MSSFCGDEHALDELIAGINSDFLCPSMDSIKAGVKTEPQQPMPPPAKPKKKRVRRQKLELDYLRDLVGKLETQMTQLKTKQQDDPLTVKQEQIEPTQSIWKPIAERQQKERARAEEKNQKLRVSLEGQLKLANKLEKILRKRPRNEEMEVLAGIKRFKPLLDTTVAPTDDEIFADQYAHVMRAHLDVDELFGGLEFSNRGNTFCDIHVMNDATSDSGVAFVTKANAMLPFDVHVTKKAFWRALAEEGATTMSYFCEPRVSTEDLLSRSCGLRFDAGCFHTNVRGKQTYRKYVDNNRAVIMWKSLWEPSEINDTKFNGLKCIQTGWIVLRGVDLSDSSELVRSDHNRCNSSMPMMSTSLQSYSKMTLELQDDIADQEFQVGALTNFVVNSHDTITEVCGKTINKVLVEEDWNLNGWLENIAI